MRLHSFFLPKTEPPLREGEERLVRDESLLHQWVHVFRLGPGDAMILADGSGSLFESSILEIGRDEARLAVGASRKGADTTPIRLTLAPSMIKKDKLEWVVQKGTELGVHAFFPVVSERSEKRGIDMRRLETIAREAAEQSGRGTLPVLAEPRALDDLLAGISSPGLALHGGEQGLDAAAVRASGKDLTLLVGPEGGWGDADLALFDAHAVLRRSLGPRVLRAETASIAAAAALLLP